MNTQLHNDSTVTTILISLKSSAYTTCIPKVKSIYHHQHEIETHKEHELYTKQLRQTELCCSYNMLAGVIVKEVENNTT